MRNLSLLSLIPLSLLLASPSLADRIFKTDGSTLDDVTIVSEGLDEVEYKPSKGRKKKTIGSHEVLSIVFEKMPPQIDSAEVAVDNELYLDAVNDLEEFLDRFSKKGPRTYPWAVPYALYRLVEVYQVAGEYPLVVTAADRVLAEAPSSRYAILAHLTKIEALHLMGDDAALKSSVAAFSTFVKDHSLPARWRLEAELRGVLFDSSLKGSKRRDKLNDVVSAAGKTSPIVKNRAMVAIGESFLKERKVGDAERMFNKVLGDPKADNFTLAGAHTGLGDCLYQKAEKVQSEGDDDEAAAGFKTASLEYMRVVVVYGDQVQYVPKAMFYAGRCFQELGDSENERRAQKLYGKLVRTYPSSKAAKEAKSFRRRAQ
ncbi:MAG: tetratricopeptide repeat protein [Planctomycetes bacterium]|nr:tetratricopeptide repeat protein [Planctomycetota bacterium]